MARKGLDDVPNPRNFPLKRLYEELRYMHLEPIARFCKLLDHKVSAFSNLKIV